MASSSATATTIQVQIPHDLKMKLDEISDRTHVPKSVVLRMGIENVINDIMSGKITLGIKFG